jgi:hypothetical protein
VSCPFWVQRMVCPFWAQKAVSPFSGQWAGVRRVVCPSWDQVVAYLFSFRRAGLRVAYPSLVQKVESRFSVQKVEGSRSRRTAVT